MATRMGTSKLCRFSDRLPVSIQAALLFISLILILSTVSFQMLPASSWGDNIDKLLVGVSWITTTKNSTRIGPNLTPTPRPGVEDLYESQQPDENLLSFKESPTGAPDDEETSDPIPPLSTSNSSVVTLTSENSSTTTAASPLVSSPAPAPPVVVSTTLAMSVS